MKFAIIYTFSTQVGEDSWRVVQSVKEGLPETTLQEIYDWQKKKSATSPIRLTIEILE